MPLLFRARIAHQNPSLAGMGRRLLAVGASKGMSVCRQLACWSTVGSLSPVMSKPGYWCTMSLAQRWMSCRWVHVVTSLGWSTRKRATSFAHQAQHRRTARTLSKPSTRQCSARMVKSPGTPQPAPGVPEMHIYCHLWCSSELSLWPASWLGPSLSAGSTDGLKSANRFCASSSRGDLRGVTVGTVDVRAVTAA